MVTREFPDAVFGLSGRAFAMSCPAAGRNR